MSGKQSGRSHEIFEVWCLRDRITVTPIAPDNLTTSPLMRLLQPSTIPALHPQFRYFQA